jgi:HPt (histidine-containing phosphotransfer) domain-containing protein
MNNRKKEVTAMQKALASEDLETVRTISHGMKGAAGIYGFDFLMEMAALIEHAAKMNNASIIQRELPLLNIYLDRVKVVYD